MVNANPKDATRADMKRVFGLTGGIGSGKSAAADVLQHLGAYVVDADLLAHEATGPNGLALADIANAFGAQFTGPQGLNRDAMRAHIAIQPDARKTLEAIVHPHVQNATMARLASMPAHAPYALLVVPLLFETSFWLDKVHGVVVVDCPETLQMERVRTRNGWPDAQIQAIMAAQCTRAERLQKATWVVSNTSTKEALTLKMQLLHTELCTYPTQKRDNMK